jgi:hypothetical protein
MNQIAKTNGNGLAPEIISALVVGGDLKGLTNEQRISYYKYRCQQVGLDPSAKPFDLLTLNGKQVLYANAGCTQQLCQIHGLSPTITGRDLVNGIYCVTSRVTGGGRTTENMGAVPVEGLKGDNLANAMMKAITKAHRRTILMHCGLGMLDELEVETIPNAQPQGRGNSLRHEFAAFSAELHACNSQEQIDLLFDSPEFKDFEERDSRQPSGMSFAGMMKDQAEQMRKKLPEKIRYEGNKIVATTEHEAPISSTDEILPEYGELVNQCFDKIDLAENMAQLSEASAFIVSNQTKMSEDDKKTLGAAYRARAKTLKEKKAA